MGETLYMIQGVGEINGQTRIERNGPSAKSVKT